VHRTLTDIDEELVAQMREHAMAYAASTPVRRVAVVANAPLEPSRERRDLIDTSDLVIRCNSLALDSVDDPPCVGTRTNVVVTARTTRPTPGFLQDYRNRAYFVGDTFSLDVPEPVGWPSYWPADLGAWPLPNRALGLPLKYLLRPTRGGLGVAPTTWMQAAFLDYRSILEAVIILTGISILFDREQQSWGYQADVPDSLVHHALKLDRQGVFLQGLVVMP